MKKATAQISVTLKSLGTKGPFEGGELFAVRLAGILLGVVENCSCWQWIGGSPVGFDGSDSEALHDAIKAALREPTPEE